MNVGDYITGIDRSYTRSIYKLLAIPETPEWNGYILKHDFPRHAISRIIKNKCIIVQFIAFEGFSPQDTPPQPHPDDISKFRLATYQEICMAKSNAAKFILDLEEDRK